LLLLPLLLLLVVLLLLLLVALRVRICNRRLHRLLWLLLLLHLLVQQRACRITPDARRLLKLLHQLRSRTAARRRHVIADGP
jgi:hypothetical protein